MKDLTKKQYEFLLKNRVIDDIDSVRVKKGLGSVASDDVEEGDYLAWFQMNCVKELDILDYVSMDITGFDMSYEGKIVTVIVVY